MLLKKDIGFAKSRSAGQPVMPVDGVQRNGSLDALRGFAILAMVLSGSVAFGGLLPAWMYHAQVPPPAHKFDPTVAGITWVDLVFPFFLFSMGAAIPLALSKLEKEGTSFWQVLWIATRRYLMLTYFALFTYHMRAWVIAEEPTTGAYLLSVFAFVLLFFQFYQNKEKSFSGLFKFIKVTAYVAAALLLYLLPFNKGEGFQLAKVDIIILVLGNMAFFGTLNWWATRNNPFLRIGLLGFVMAIFLGAKEKGSWNEAVFNWSPLPWMYKFYYLKYLFIILPGTIAGEWLLKEKTQKGEHSTQKRIAALLALNSFGIVVCNVALLFSRMLVWNLALSVLLCIGLHYLLRKFKENELLQKFWNAGFYLLLLGLAFEAFEGGIRKDSSTYSYYFVTSGLAFFMLIGFYGLQQIKVGGGITNYLSLNGCNPMVAYVAGNLLLTPVLHLTGGIELFNAMNQNASLGFLKGVLFTGIISLITIFFTKQKWFWKT